MSVRGAIKKEQFVSLKIFVHNQTKVFNFDISTLVETVLQAVYDSSPPEITSSPLSEYGLFVPNQRGRKPRWLLKSISLDAADCNSQDPLEFKKKLRPMRVMTVDGNVKMIYIDDSAVVRDIADAVGDKLGVKALEEFSLRKKTPAGMAKAPKWLSETQTLHDNDVTADETLEYAKKYYFSDDRVDQEDPFTLHLLYVDAQQSILTGRYPTSRANIVEFAGLQLQIQFGDHKPGTHTEKFFDKRTLIPAKWLAEDKKTPLLPEIINAHKRFVGIKETNAKYRYVTKVRSLPTYGITFFECTQVKEKTGDKKKDKEEPVPFLLGVSRSCLIRMETETQKETNSWPIECIKRWSQTKGTFSIDFGDWEGDYFNFQTPESEALSALIYGYIEIIMRSRNDIGNVREDDDYYDVAEVESVKPIFGFGQDGVTAGYTQGYAATSQIPLHTPTGQFQNFNFPEFSRLVHQDTKELYGKAMMGSDGTQLTPKELAARQMLQKGGARPDNSPVPKSNPQPKQDYEPKLREMLNRVINQMDTLVDTMSQNSFPPILDQYKNILENDLQGLFNCLEGIQQDPDQQVALSHMVRATKPITDCIGDILELLAESETVLIDTYRDDIFDQIKCYWDAAKSSVLNDPALVDSPTIELINLASLQVAEKFSNLLDSLEQMIAVPPDHMLLEESNYILAEIGKCRMINKMVNCNNMRLCQYFLDPDVNQAFVQMTEIVEHSKNTVIDFFDRSSFNDGNNNIHEIGREIDFDIDKLKFIVACADPQRPTGPDGNPLDYGETPEQVAAFKLRMAAKVNAASVLKLLNASENALRNCSDPNVANELWNAIQKGQGALMDLFVVMNQPVTPENPNALLNVAREQIPIFQELARVAKKATPLITDATKKSELSGACQKMNRDLGYLFQNVQEVYNMSLGTEVNNPNAPQGASKVGQLRGAPLSNSQSGAQLSQASQQQINEEALAAKRELKKQAKVFIPKEEMQVAYQHIAKAKQILEEKNVDRVALAKQEAADAMFQTANRRRQVNFKMATESLSTSLKTMQATSNQLANVAAKNPAGCPVIMKMLSSSIEQVLQNALKAAASTDRPVSDQIIESAHFIADATQDLLMAVEAEANNKTPETTRELEQRKLIVNDAVNKLNQLLGISSEIRLPEVEKSLNDLKESMDFYSGGPAGLQGAGRLQGSVKLSGPQGSMLFSHNQPVCEFSVELKELAGIVAGITKSARSSTINHGAHAREATAILQKLLQSAAKVESDSVYSALTSDKDELFQLFDQIHNSSDQFVVLENMKKVNNTVQKLIVYGKEAAKKETDKGRQGQIIQNIQQLMTGFQNLQQSAAQTSTRGPADVSQIKQNVADLVATLLQNNASQSVSESDLVCDPLLAADISKATKALAQTTHDMLAASIKVAQNPQDMTTTQTFEASTKDVVNSLLELKKLTNGLDSGLKECAKAVNKIQTETSYILNDPRFQNDPNAYASLIDTSPQRRAQSAALQAQAVTTLSQVEKQLQGLCGHLLQSETPLIGDQQQVDLKALAQSLSGLVPSFVGSINEIITAQEDSNFRKNLVGNTRQLVQITEDLLKYSQTDYRNLTAEDLQRIAQLKIRAQESAGIVASELKIADTINQEIDKESQIIRGAIEKLLQPIHLVPQGQGGPQGPGQVRVVQGQGTNQRVSMSQGVNTNSQRMPPNAVPLGQNSNQPRMSVGPNGQPIQQGGQGFPRPSVGQGQGTNSQRIVQQGQNPNQQGGQGQLTSPRQGQPGNPQNPQQGQPRPSVGPNGQPINQGPTSPRGPQQGGPQGQPVRVQGQPGNPQNPQQGTNTQQRVVQGQPQGGQQQGLNTLQRLMTNVQPGKGPAPNANPAQGGPKMQYPQKLKPPQTYAEWKGVNLAAQREIVKATQFLQTCDKRNVESMTFAIRKQKAVLLSLVESARQCAALVKDENEKRELLNNAKVVCANVDSIFQDLKQASCGFDVQQNVNTKLNNINDGIAALLQSINRCEPEKPVIVEETITETLTIEESKEFQEFITYLKGKVNGFYADQKPSRFSRDSCDDLFNTCKDVAKMLTKVLYTTKKDLTTLNTDAKPLIEKLFQLANSFHSHYHQHPLAAEFKQQVGQTVLQFSTALESVANAKGNERKEIEAAVQESIKNLTGIVGFITKISPKFSQEHADAERLMEEANRRVMAGAQGKSALEIKMEEELRQEREHQIRVIKIEKELQKEKDRALAEKKARFEAQQGGQ